MQGFSSSQMKFVLMVVAIILALAVYRLLFMLR